MTEPVIVNPYEYSWTHNAYRFAFGAYADTVCVVFANGMEDALETAAEWLSENAPGHLSTHDELAADGCWDESTGEMIDHTYTESGYLASWEWWVDDVDRAEWIDKALVQLLEDGELEEPTFDRFDVCEAWYLWLSANHGGQDSPEYARLSSLLKSFKPSPLLSPERLSDNGRAIYAQLVKAHAR